MKYFVSKYIPQGLYGFLEDSDRCRLFFHLSEFRSIGAPAIPIVGEEVEIQRSVPHGDKSPRAYGVRRLAPPLFLEGVVSRFDPNTGYGFIVVGGQSYFLHRSEFESGALPSVGSRVTFYACQPKGPQVPRACHAVLVERGLK